MSKSILLGSSVYRYNHILYENGYLILSSSILLIIFICEVEIKGYVVLCYVVRRGNTERDWVRERATKVGTEITMKLNSKHTRAHRKLKCYIDNFSI